MNQRKEQRSMDCIIRKATSTDATAISLVVAAALRESNAQDYSPEIIEQVQQNFSPAAILNFLGQREVYVASDARISWSDRFGDHHASRIRTTARPFSA